MVEWMGQCLRRLYLFDVAHSFEHSFVFVKDLRDLRICVLKDVGDNFDIR